MEKDEEIESRLETIGNNPPRKIYSLTEKGKSIIREEILQNINNVKVRLFDWWRNIPLITGEITKEEMLKAIEKRRVALLKMSLTRNEKIRRFHLKEYENGEKNTFPGVVFLPVIFDLIENIGNYELKALDLLEKEVNKEIYKNLFLKESEVK